MIKTNLWRYQPKSDESDDDEPRRFRYKSIAAGTATQCFVATSPDLAEVTGDYFVDCNPALPNEHMQDDELAAKLWQVSEELTADYIA